MLDGHEAVLRGRWVHTGCRVVGGIKGGGGLGKQIGDRRKASQHECAAAHIRANRRRGRMPGRRDAREATRCNVTRHKGGGRKRQAGNERENGGLWGREVL